MLERWQRFIAAGERFDMVFAIRGKDGVFHPFLASVLPMKDDAGRVEAWVATGTGITERRSAADMHQHMIALVESAEDAILSKGLDGIIRSWNPAAERMLGYGASEIIGQSVLRLIPEDRQGEESMILERISRGERVASLETIRRRKDGSLIEVSLTISPIRDAASNVVGASKIMRDITDRRRMEAETARVLQRLTEAQRRLRLMVNELNHRVKNTLAVVQAIASQTLRDTDPAAYEAFEDRVMALAAAHGVLTRESWKGADVHEVVVGQLMHYGAAAGGDRFHLSGPQLRLNSGAILALALALHELATNALKYGALSVPAGRVAIHWEVAERATPTFRLSWSEQRGPKVSPPVKRGFGAELIEHTLGSDLGGSARLDFDDPEGVTCVMETPLAQVSAPAGATDEDWLEVSE
jgi:PAS domain S-box-containing protein